MFSLRLHHFPTLSTLWKEMEIGESGGFLLGFDTDILNTFICHLLKLLPGLRVKSVHIDPPWADMGLKPGLWLRSRSPAKVLKPKPKPKPVFLEGR